MLATCPKCNRSFPEGSAQFCPQDSTRLVPVDQVPVPKDPQDPFVGHSVAGKYEIRRVVADGGMGRVYEACQRDPERRVAVKILHDDIAEDTVNIERFKREAETSRSLDHAHIVDVLDFNEEKNAPGRARGAWFLVMEYLDGEELRSVVKTEKVLPLTRIIRITAQAAIALDGAHARGYVHRDLKPDNVFLVRSDKGDCVKLLDFGSVKFTKGQDKGQKLTVMGTTIGSPHYMSPEQARGLADLDQRADVWALGAIIYEMAVGKVPFQAPNNPQILFKILGEEPMPPSFANDAAPPELDDFMLRALAKKRDERFASCGQLADALGHAFKLPGTHLLWAQQSEYELGERLGARGSIEPVTTKLPAVTLTSATTATTKSKPAGDPGTGPKAPSAIVAPVPDGRPSGIGDGVPDDYSPIKKAPVGLYVGVAGVLAVVIGLAVYALH